MTRTVQAPASASTIRLADQESYKQVSFARDVWRRFSRNRLALVGVVAVVVLVLYAVFADTGRAL